MNLTLNVSGLLTLERQLRLLAMNPATQRRLLYRIALQVIKDSRKRVRTQTDLQGRPFAERWKRRSDRRKMLSRLIKSAKVINNDASKAIIGFSRGGIIAAKQQLGFSQTITAAQNRRAGRSTQTGPASRQQATKLKLLGFKARQGGRLRAVSARWIMDNMTSAQAGAVLSSMRAQQGISRHESWQTTIPARSFLGASQHEIQAHINAIFDQINARIRRA